METNLNNKLSKTCIEAGKALELAVYEEILKKSKLDQYVIIQRDGKTCRVPATELIKTIKKPEQLKNS